VGTLKIKSGWKWSAKTDAKDLVNSGGDWCDSKSQGLTLRLQKMN
jgi:hypothetical protein